MFRKDLKVELRTRSGLFSAGLFSIVAVVAVSFAASGRQLDGTVAAGLFWVTLLFSSVISLPRSFVSEEESGTADLLRLMARPHAVFWGKVFFNLMQIALTGVVLSILFIAMANLNATNMGLYLLALVGGCAALSVAVTLCGALVAQAANRAALAAAIGVPIMIPLVAMGVGATRVAFGAGQVQSGLNATFGLYAFAVLLGAVGPYLYAAVWKS